VPLLATPFGLDYLVNMTVGGQVFAAIIDTGSSNTCVPAMNFTCLNATSGEEVPQAQCAFGALYDPEASSTFVPIDGVNMQIKYGELLSVISADYLC
jgi:hypothetical protein